MIPVPEGEVCNFVNVTILSFIPAMGYGKYDSCQKDVFMVFPLLRIIETFTEVYYISACRSMRDRETTLKRFITFAFLFCDANDTETTDFSFINETFCNQCHFLHDFDKFCKH